MSIVAKLRVSTALCLVFSACPTMAPAQEAFLNKNVPAFMDTGATNQRGDARYATKETNAAVRLLSGFLDIWQPRTPFVDAGTSAPARDGFPAVPTTDWDGVPGSATDGTILNWAVHEYNIQYVINATRNRTAQQAVDAYLDDRRGKAISMLDGLGPLQDAWVKGTKQFTTILDVAPDATTVKYDDMGNNTGIGSSSNPDLGLAVDLLGRVGWDASTEPSKRYFKYARPWRWSSDVQVLPALEPAKSSTPVTDGGFPSGHTAEAWRNALAMAYLVPQRYQELVTRAVAMGDSRILAGMHSPLDVIGGRMLGTAAVVYNLNRQNGDGGFNWQDLKTQAYEQTQAWLKKETNSTTASDLYVAAHAADLSTDRFASREANAAYVATRMTYGFAPVGPTDQPAYVPKGAEVLLETRMPYLSADQRRAILATTALPSGYPVMDDPEGYGRLNLFAAVDGYGAFREDVTVNMDKSLDGFNAFDAWRNDISGSGKLTKEGTGTLMLTGLNTYSGGTRVNAGMLVGTNGNAFGTGAIQIDAAGQLMVNTLVDSTLANTISGTGMFEKRGTGGLVYTGDGSQFTGTTLISGGRFAVNGSWGGALDMENGAILGGNGTVANVMLKSGSRLSPGNSIGTLNINGDLTLSSGSAYDLEIAHNGTSDRTIVSGAAAIDDASLNVIALDPAVSYAAGQSYTFLTADNMTGQFGDLLIDSAFIDSKLFYTANDVTLRLSSWDGRAFTTAAHTANQRAAASALDVLDQSAGSSSLPLYNAVLFMNAENARNAFDEISGEEHASTQSALLANSRIISDTVLDRLSSGDTGAWTSGYGMRSRFGSDGNAASYDLSGGGVFLGGDGFVSDDVRLGVMTGWGRSSLSSDRTSGSADVDSYHIGVYGGTDMDQLSLKAGAAYSFNQIETKRSLRLGSFSDQLTAEYDAGLAQLFAEASYAFELPKQVKLSPFANLSYAILSTDGFSEAGGAAALSATDSDADVTFTTAGLRAEGDFDVNGTAMTWNAMAGWQHAFGDMTPESRMFLARGGSFSVSGAPIGRDAAKVSLGMGMKISQNVDLGLSYHGEFSEDVTENKARADFKLRF
ncbi:autotransporter domain-containing protein [Phyllobacterium salinisoli]|uniref:Autotransporter domain-containing protein n=1 Tax=Phyllobacterium salinisoli TaxID=1899321 RepID=A0A368K1B8_9HYPH|nr:autotransporter domain-containing protein [Phyllobacterium salinisoli]